uniref:Ribosomal protein L29 n=1 Tax=Tolypiocladia glomerulata TaxID=860646 RepID=A0A1Z1MUK9_9FLOR|nr:ribosomal protein L29 [Tolypiocladia glomerulata]ARW69787.1 ribosomal protein L29 [Tolypiocladia glomerulata]
MNIEEKIYTLKKELLLLRIKKITKQNFKSEEIKKIQHQISQINFQKTNKKNG